MDAARHARAKQVFLDLCDLPPDQRRAALQRGCGTDTELAREVEAMLAFDAHGGERLTRGPVPGVELEPGVVLDGRFEIRELLGVGGLGEVWAAEQRSPVRRPVAVKVVKLGMDTRRVLARFEGERQTLAILDHPHIAHVFDAGTTPAGRPYFAMERIEGTPLVAYAQRASLGLRDRLRLVLQLCQAVQHAHQKGVIHRDLKPSNVLVTQVDGAPFVKVIDFGIAKAVQAGESRENATLDQQVIGTPAYMSPEQARDGSDVDTRTDVWALGVILFELLAGATPFESKSGPVGALAHLLVDTPTPRPSTRVGAAGPVLRIRREELRGDLDWIVLKALERDRERRYPSAAALAEDLERHLRHEPVLARPPSRIYQLRKFVRRNRVASAAALIVLVALVTTVLVTAHSRNAEHDARVEAEAALGEAESAGWFLAEMLGAANPHDMGRDVRVVDVLARAEGAIGTRFQDRPRAEIRVRRILGSTFRELGQLDEALKFQQRALEQARAAYPPQHPAILEVLLSITALYDELARYAESEPLHREILELYPVVYGPYARRTLGGRCNFGLFLYDQSRFQEAEEALRATLADMQQHLDPNDGYLVNCMQGLGTAVLELGRHAEARELFLEVVRRAETKGGRRSPTAAQATTNLALTATLAGRHREALEILEDALDRNVLAYGEEHWRIGRLYVTRADAHLGLGDRAAARADLARAHELSAAAFGADHPWTIEQAQRLAELDGTTPPAAGR